MPSEQRLHPASMLFAFARSAKNYALPGLLLLLSAGRSSGGSGATFGRVPANWEIWIMLLLIPSALVALARYLSFRIQYEGTELVIRSGIIFRNERHVPYARIQNLDAVQNLFHRALGVVEVRVETGGGKEPEARISVLPAAAFTEMRRRVFEGRSHAAIASSPDDASHAGSAEPPVLLHLPLRELLLFGFLENRGLVVVGAAYGLAWELGLLERFWGRIFDDESYAPGMIAGLVDSIATGNPLSLGRVPVLLAGVAGLLVAVRVLSMAWGAIRLYEFRLTRAGADLQTRFGLLTRVTTTIPIRRVQTMTIRQGPLHRLLKRISVQVETAGGGHPGSGGSRSEREWLAPLIRSTELQHLVREVLPELDITGLDWQPAHPRAFRRAVKAPLFGTFAICAVLTWLFGWWALGVLPFMIPWAILAARKHVSHLGWLTSDDVVAFRSGWLWRSVTVARVAKIQVVALHESPFDRRTAMASVRVDTAGAGERSHRVDIPYLLRETAGHLHSRLAALAARTAFNIR